MHILPTNHPQAFGIIELRQPIQPHLLYAHLITTPQAIGDYDENGRVKNTLALPTGLTKAQLRTWLDENIPKHLKNRVLEQGTLA